MSTNGQSRTALLIAAHGERRPGAGNEGTLRVARALSDRNLVSEVAVGFINGVPSIKDAVAALPASKIIVYPLFVASGYFTRDRLVQLLDEANDEGRNVRILPPLGLDPGLPHVVLAFARQAARKNGLVLHDCAVILLAHGSKRNPASREATEGMAREIAGRVAFRDVRIALLEEPPSLEETAALVQGPAVVVGMFSGEGLHGARDAPGLVAKLGRADVVYAGVIGGASGIEDVVARSVAAALNEYT